VKNITVITGLTATGKTGLAIKMAKELKADIISADSRQIYKDMDIGTGKDIGKSRFKLVEKVGQMDIGYHTVEGIRIWLLDIVEPDISFSVSDYLLAFDKAVAQIEKRGRQIIVAGGTGYYIDSLLNPKANFGLAPNKALRYVFNRLPTKVIKIIYKLLNNREFEKLNNSEKNNRHRLIRKIEIKLSRKNQRGNTEKKYGGRIICLTAKNEVIYRRIDKRVKRRLDEGLLAEVERLKKKYGWKAPGLNCLAYKEFVGYFGGVKSIKECIEKWRGNEHAYARRQKTWFKKMKYEMTDIRKIAKREWYNSL